MIIIRVGTLTWKISDIEDDLTHDLFWHVRLQARKRARRAHFFGWHACLFPLKQQ